MVPRRCGRSGEAFHVKHRGVVVGLRAVPARQVPTEKRQLGFVPALA